MFIEGARAPQRRLRRVLTIERTTSRATIPPRCARAQDHAIDVHCRPPVDVALADDIDADRACFYAPAAAPTTRSLLARALRLAFADDHAHARPPRLHCRREG